ncbi:competence protein [Paenibacillus swuensis]|uniref:Pyrroline-5-carboxylate reductase n=1 Tax=Paenibacillus swuensis TaxID=1178515 RepID=A0A172TJX2_9BACL|nr:late competence protein ComER [Paenibacillus swuensis]ANE47272.1 competence protein [Paenibacillus swuensis]
MRIGFIGTGSMGSILIESFIQSGAVLPQKIVAANRTFVKAQTLATKYPGLQAVHNNTTVAMTADIVFLCVKPKEFRKVIEEIKDDLKPEQLLVSITSPVQIRQLEAEVPSKVSKIIPSITNYVCSGATLCIHGARVMPEEQLLLENLLEHVSMPIRIEEEFTRVSSDLSSCGPAFLAFFVQKFVDAAVEETGIPHEEATRLASEMVLGTGKLLTVGGFTPETLQKRVSVPGGITEEALRLLSVRLHGVFNELIETTHKKYYEDVEQVEAQFYVQKVD